MKQLYILSAILFLTLSAQGQVIHDDNNPTVPINGTIVNVDVDHAGQNVYMHCINDGAVTVNWKFRRVILNQSTSFTDEFCDNLACVPATGNDWTTPYTVPVAAGDSTIFKPVLTFTGGGTALIRYYVLDDGDEKLDSVDLNVNSTVSFDEQVKVNVSTYPNPASDVFNIVLDKLNGNNVEVEFLSVLGSRISVIKLKEGTNSIDVTSFKNGVYFYAIKQNGEIIETKKLLIRK